MASLSGEDWKRAHDFQVELFITNRLGSAQVSQENRAATALEARLGNQG